MCVRFIRKTRIGHNGLEGEISGRWQRNPRLSLHLTRAYLPARYIQGPLYSPSVRFGFSSFPSFLWIQFYERQSKQTNTHTSRELEKEIKTRTKYYIYIYLSIRSYANVRYFLVMTYSFSTRNDMAMILYAFQKFNESNKKSRSFFKFRVPLSIRLLTRMGK